MRREKSEPVESGVRGDPVKLLISVRYLMRVVSAARSTSLLVVLALHTNRLHLQHIQVKSIYVQGQEQVD